MVSHTNNLHTEAVSPLHKLRFEGSKSQLLLREDYSKGLLDRQ